MKRKYELTPKHRQQLAPWRDKWIQNAMSTAAMDDGDRATCRDAVKRLYAAAKLEPPPDERIIFVSSPFVMRYAGGFAAWIWYCRKHPEAHRAAAGDATWAATGDAAFAATWAATRDAAWAATWAPTRDATGDATWAATRAATEDATRDAAWAATRDAAWAAAWAATWAPTRDATGDATWAATRAATEDATRDATWAATRGATWAATWAATRDATEDATRDATWAATRGATWAATRGALDRWYVFPDVRPLADALGVGLAGMMCADAADRMCDGGNQWSGEAAFLSFFRHIAKLDIDYTAWDSWETLCLHSGPRIMHEKFCIISDRPELLTVDEQNRPHSDAGPFCRWRDRSALYAVHGVPMPAWIIEHPDHITVAKIDTETNTEVQRVMIERFGWDRYADECGAVVVDHDERWGTLFRASSQRLFLKVINRSPEPDGSFRRYILPVMDRLEPLPDPEDRDGELGDPQKLTALNAVASTFGLTGREYERVLGAES